MVSYYMKYTVHTRLQRVNILFWYFIQTKKELTVVLVYTIQVINIANEYCLSADLKQGTSLCASNFELMMFSNCCQSAVFPLSSQQLSHIGPKSEVQCAKNKTNCATNFALRKMVYISNKNNEEKCVETRKVEKYSRNQKKV